MLENIFDNYVANSLQNTIYFGTNFNRFEKQSFSEPVLVFNYGIGCSNLHWEPIISYFDKLGKHILIHDYRGHFKSTGNYDIKSISFETITDDIKLIMDECKIKSAIMLGHSMGTNIVLEFAKKFPQMINKMILISGTVLPVTEVMFNSTIMKYLTPPIQKFTKNASPLLRICWKTPGISSIVHNIVKRKGFNIKVASNQFITEYINRICQIDNKIFFQLFRQMNKNKDIDYLKDLEIPTLIIGGKKDKVIPHYLQEILHKYLPISELWAIDEAGHVPQIDFPDLVNDRISKFI